MMKKYSSEIEIDGVKIGLSYPTYFIADIAANHDGSLSRAKDLIWQAAESGADAAKFQHFQAETIVSDFGFKSLGSQKSHQSTWNKSVFEVYKDASVKLEWTVELKRTCDEAGIPFFSTPYSLDVVDYLDQYVPAYKIGSGDITWLEMIQKVASKNKPYILATGASTFDDVIRAVDVALSNNPNLGLMQCNTNYTASLDNFRHIQLNVLRAYQSMYPGLVIGLSDHTPGHATVLGAVTLGARMIEKHFTDNTLRDGPDHKFSMDPKSWKEMVERTRELELALGSGIKRIEENEAETAILQRRSLRVISSLKKGHKIKRSDLAVLRPCPRDAVSPAEINYVIGKSLMIDMAEGEYLRYEDLS